MKSLLLMAVAIQACTTYYPMRRSYGGCDRVIDQINYRGGPIFLILLLIIIVLLARINTNKK